MKRTELDVESRRWKLLLPFLALLLRWALPATAKTAVDFDRNLDFSKYQTFAYIGGEKQLSRLQLNPDQFNNQIHRAVVRKRTSKGLREVNEEENPDLVVRYWLESQSQAHVTGTAHWATYGNYYTAHWTVQYTTMSSSTTHQGTLGIELIDAKTRDLAWRMFGSERITHSDQEQIWKTTDSNIKKALKATSLRRRPSKKRNGSGRKKMPPRRLLNRSI
jgi:hypothetical protein